VAERIDFMLTGYFVPKELMPKVIFSMLIWCQY